MDSMRILVVMFFTSLSFVAHSYGDLIDDVCQKTIDYNLCVKSLRADPRSASADKKSLARIIINSDTAGKTLSDVDTWDESFTESPPVLRKTQKSHHTDQRNSVSNFPGKSSVVRFRILLRSERLPAAKWTPPPLNS
uniref:Cell wall / vacuolar inhibitor of fructosidase 1-like n=1 Tax=Nicotiana sylvestris TaxID=4096 RepID=A0A1U7VT91_NICSY|nr:PREDICTED: cell wall / vacuolar inhibitor of fructosidase 1-like [Nicotiana sylvestris]